MGCINRQAPGNQVNAGELVDAGESKANALVKDHESAPCRASDSRELVAAGELSEVTKVLDVTKSSDANAFVHAAQSPGNNEGSGTRELVGAGALCAGHRHRGPRGSDVGAGSSDSGLSRAVLGDAGMSTVEYAVGTVVAAAFAAVLYKIVTGDSVIAGLTNLINTALSTSF